MVIPTIGEVLPAAVAIGLSPIAVIAVVAVLSGRDGRRNGPLFAAGWATGLTAITLFGTLVIDQVDVSPTGGSVTWADGVRLVLGIGLIAAAVVKWRSRPRPGAPPPDPPAWTRTIDGAGGGRTLVIGLLLGGVNPKNIGFGLAAAASIAGAQLDRSGTALVILAFVAIGSIAVVSMVLARVLLGDRSDRALGSMREFMVQHGNVVMMVLFLVIGANVLGDSLQALRR